MSLRCKSRGGFYDAIMTDNRNRLGSPNRANQSRAVDN